MVDDDVVIRRAGAADAAAMVQIYRPHVERSAVSFELRTPTVDEFAARIAEAQRRHEWLVAESGGEVLGYAYGSPHRAREAYRYTAEVSAYVADHAQRRGVGTELYGQLFHLLCERGYCNVVAGITMPNDRSVAFHLHMGFSAIGVYHRVGFKFDAWRDVGWFERRLREGAPPDSVGPP